MKGLEEINKLNEIATTQGDKAVLALVNRGVSIDMNLKARKKKAEKVNEGGEHWTRTSFIHPIEDWQYELQNGDTRLGYAEWL